MKKYQLTEFGGVYQVQVVVVTIKENSGCIRSIGERQSEAEAGSR
jgi:hypothetical protein